MFQSARKRGLTTRDTQDLKRTIGDLKKLVPMAQDLAQALGEEQGKPFAKVAEDGAAVGNQAQQVLTADYGDAMRTEGLRRPVEVPKR
jgi:hypothetical protein